MIEPGAATALGKECTAPIFREYLVVQNFEHLKSQLIASGMDVLTISRRLGHDSPSVTLDVYSHLFKPTDKAAAAVFESAFGNAPADENASTDAERSENEIGGRLAASVLPLRLPPPSSI